MKKFEKFLQSCFYPLLMVVAGFSAWVSKGNLIHLNYTIIVLLLVFMSVILALFKDTKHIIPIVLTLLFVINIENIGLTEIRQLSIVYVIVGLVVIGLAIHFLRFKHKIKADLFTLALFLIAISYVLPMMYMEYSNTSFAISMFGFVYVILHMFFKSTSTTKLEELMNFMFYASLLILSQMLYSHITGFIRFFNEYGSVELALANGLRSAWGSIDYGYGSINDVIIYFTVLSMGTFYKIIKKPKNYLYWLFLIISFVAVVLSGSRGGLISWMVILLGFYILLIGFGTRMQVAFSSLIGVALVGLGVWQLDILKAIYEVFMQGGLQDLDSFSSARITLYRNAWSIFEQFPYFGAGWTYQLEAGNTNRVQIYHSTLFHTLAISGIAGLGAVFFFTIVSLGKIIRRLNIKVAVVGLVFGVVMLHGLIDNTVHMIIFTILSILIFAALSYEKPAVETSKLKEKKSSKEDIKSLKTEEIKLVQEVKEMKEKEVVDVKETVIEKEQPVDEKLDEKPKGKKAKKDKKAKKKAKVEPKEKEVVEVKELKEEQEKPAVEKEPVDEPVVEKESADKPLDKKAKKAKKKAKAEPKKVDKKKKPDKKAKAKKASSDKKPAVPVKKETGKEKRKRLKAERIAREKAKIEKARQKREGKLALFEKEGKHYYDYVFKDKK